MNTGQSTQAVPAPGNRITFTSQALPNGTINIGSGGSTIISTSQLPNTTTIKTITASGAGGVTSTQHHGSLQVQHHQVLQSAGVAAGSGQQPPALTSQHQQHTHQQQQQQQQHQQQLHQHQQQHQQHNAQSVGGTQTQTLVIKSNHAVSLPAGLVSSAPGIVTMTKTINQGNQQLMNSMIPASVVVGMRPPNTQQQQKNVQGNSLGRVVIGGPHMVGSRPQSPAITLSALTPGQTPALILKTENGFQLLRVGTATTSPVTQTIGTNSSNPTQIRLQTVPAAVSRFAGPPLALRKTIVRSSTSTTTTTTTTQQQSQMQQLQQIQQHQQQQQQQLQHQHQQQQQQQQQAQQQQQQQSQLANATTKQSKQNSIATTSSGNNIIVNSVASTNSTSHVYTTQANISLQQHHQQQQQQPPHATLQQHLQQQQLQALHHHHQQQQQQQHQTQHLHAQPQITQIQTLPPHPTQQSQLQQQQQHQQQQQGGSANNSSGNNSSNNNAGGGTTTTNSVPSALSVGSGVTGAGSVSSVPQSSVAQGNTKEKCRKFLANLIDLSTREPKPVEKNVRNLIQELVNANVEPEEFCDRLERLLNASPQPCLIGFLKKSLPLLRQALYNKELLIEGIKPPPQHVVNMTTLQQQLPKIQAQIRPISQGPSTTTTIGQTQVRMISPQVGMPRPLSHTTIRQGGIRIQSPSTTVGAGMAPRLVNAHIRGPISMQHQQQSTPSSIVQIRAPPVAPHLSRPTTVQIRTTKQGKGAAPPGITHVKVGQTQIKAIASPTSIVATSSQPPQLTAISNHSTSLAAAAAAAAGAISSSTLSSSSSILSTINSVASNSIAGSGINAHPSLPTPSLPTVHLPPAALALANSVTADIKSDMLAGSVRAAAALSTAVDAPAIKAEKGGITSNTPLKSAAKTGASTSKAASKKKKEQQDKDDKSTTGGSASTAAAMSAFYQQPSISMSSSLYGDDDINDVAAMGGVNLAEESQRILGSTENIGTQIRSCKDEVFLHLPALQARIRSMVVERGLEEPSQDVAVLISHACQERLKNIVEKLAVIAEHRIDVIKLDPRYEVTKDVRGQIKFLEELDKAEQKRHEELEREMLLRAAKSRSKIEDPEQAKMKARAKEMQRAEMEELRQRDANMTALQAIGPRKKLKLDSDAAGTGTSTGSAGAMSTAGTAPAPLRPRIKRVNLRDMLFFMEQERETCRSEILYKAYLK